MSKDFWLVKISKGGLIEAATPLANKLKTMIWVYPSTTLTPREGMALCVQAKAKVTAIREAKEKFTMILEDGRWEEYIPKKSAMSRMQALKEKLDTYKQEPAEPNPEYVKAWDFIPLTNASE